MLRDYLTVYRNKVQKLIQDHTALCEEEQRIKAARVALDKQEMDLIRELEDVGLTMFGMDDGTKLSVMETHHCSINANIEDKWNVAEWLKENGADDLVKNTWLSYTKPKDVQSIETVEMNTTKVKSWLIRALGLKEGNMATIEHKDLPKGLHLFTEKRIKIE